jgi:CheY-like chemotaxis protein
LINNAAKYSDPGGRIVVSAEIGAGEVTVRVTDNGIGIRADHLPHVFNMFAQFDTPYERSHGGLGIGLCLVRRLVEMHDGTIEARSVGPGSGSEFTVRLPVVSEPLAHPAKPDEDGVQSESLPKRRILIVDDNRLSSKSTAMLLRLMGHEPAAAHDGFEGIESAKTFRPDVILLDIGLPRLNGYEVARRIRQEPWGKDIFLIATTGFGQDEDRRRSSAAGFDDHIVKPVNVAELEKKLSDLPRERRLG